MKLISANSFSGVLPVVLIVCSCFRLFSQPASYCPISVAKEPRTTSISLRPTSIKQNKYTYLKSWVNLQMANNSDEQKASVILPGLSHSKTITFSEFKANLPAGAFIHGIEVYVEGQSSDYKSIGELSVTLHSQLKTTESQNKANTAILQKAWSFLPDGKDKTWRYGHEKDTWGVNWTSELLNSTDFSLDIQIRNALTSEINAFIDDVRVIIHYTPLYSFCTDSCVVFYVDAYNNAHSYHWQLPENFMVVSRENENTINIKGANAVLGKYDICVDIFNDNGQILESCCRSFNYEDCSLNAIKGRVWEDLNQNDRRDFGEPGLSGINVFLFNANGQKISEILSDDLGQYQFDNLPSASYYLAIGEQPGKEFVLDNMAIPRTENSDITLAFGPGTTDIYTLQNGVCLENIDFGLTPAVSIGDFVWLDKNADGIQDPDEPGLDDITVQLLDPNLNIVSETVTQNGGQYFFHDVAAGSYSLYFQSTTKYFPTCALTNLPHLNSNIDEQGYTALYHFIGGTTTDSIDAGFVEYGSISGKVWEDKNADGYLDILETGLAQVLVSLQGVTTCGENIDRDILSSSNGSYQFDKIKPGFYFLHFETDQKYFPTQIPGTDSLANKMDIDFNIPEFEIQSGQNLQNLHAGLYRLGAISGRIWNDKNTNSLQEADELGVKDVVVNLKGLTAFGDSIMIVGTSDANGGYEFVDLIPGLYEVSIETGMDYMHSPKKIDIDTTIDNNSDEGQISELNLCSGDVLSNLDFGVFELSSLGDHIWEDINGNGIFDIGEPGIEGVELELNGTDNFGNVVQTMTVSNATGGYLFNLLNPGNYVIKLVNTLLYTITIPKQGTNDEIDSDFFENNETQAITLSAGEHNVLIDGGLYQTGIISGLVYEDFNCDGIFGFIDSRQGAVELHLNGTTNTGKVVFISTLTSFDGTYSFSDLEPGVYSVTIILNSGFQSQNPTLNFLNIQSGSDLQQIDFPVFRYGTIGDFVWLDENGDGIQDVQELGLHNVLVTLSGFAGGSPVFRTTQTINGFYLFENVKPGEYTLQFPQLQDLSPTLVHAGNPEFDNDMDANGFITSIFLSSGQQQTDLDAGYSEIAMGAVGDFVWLDSNGDGIQDADEPGLANVEVFISGVENSGTIVNRSTISDNSGFYTFENLRAGNYTVTFHLPLGFKFSEPEKGNGENDSKPDITSGEAPSFFLNAGEIKNNIDAGAYFPGTIGDFVWFDINENGLQDPDEVGLEGIMLSIYNSDNQQLVATTISDINGLYLFENLAPGNYVIEAHIPEDKTVTLYQMGGNEFNSDFENINDSIRTNIITMVSGFSILDVDLGLIEKRTEIGGHLWRDLNADGIREFGEPAINNVVVLLLNESGDTLATSVTDSLGYYYFGNLTGGLFRVLFPLFDSLTFTRYNVGSDPALNSDVLDRFSGIVLINLNEGDRNVNIGAGYILKSTIGDYVWLDENENGLQDINEIGVNGVKVYLYNLSNIVLDSTITSVKPVNGLSGYYQFQNVFPGDYYVRFNLPNNVLFTQHTDSFPDINSDVTGEFGLGTTDTILIDFQEDNFSVDAGLIIDEDALGEIRGLVWQDENANGTREFGDLLLEGVEVKLFTLDGMEKAITFTDIEGRYSFGNLFFGSYYLSIPNIENRVFVLFNGMNTDIDSDITNDFGQGTSRIISLFPGDTITNFDLGYAPKISIGNLVWEDLNNNGIQDVGEPGISGVTIHLLNSSGVTIATKITDGNGQFVFGELPAGNYGLRVIVPEGFIIAKANVGPSDIDSKANENGFVANRDFLAAGNYTNLDIGMFRSATIGSRLWLDLNGNGIFSENEPGIQDIMVELYDQNSVLIQSTKTGPMPGNSFVGLYQFKGLRPGNYYVKFLIPDNYELSPALVGNFDTDSDITNIYGRGTTEFFNVQVGENKLTVDGGAYLPAFIGDFVWDDLNQNGNQDVGEPGIPDVLVSLFLSNGQLLDSVRTDLNGEYTFSNLKSRLYYLHIELKSGYQFTLPYNGNSSATDSDVDQTGTTPLISLAHGSVFLDVDAGMFASQNKIVMGIMWDDINKNGMKDFDEKILSGVKVLLTTGSGFVLSEFTTNHAGLYCHQMDEAGVYNIQVLEKPNYKISKRAVHGNMICNDFNANGMSDAFPFDTSPALQYKNGGMFFQPSTSLSGTIWLDNDGNVIKDNTDDLLENIVVLLFTQQNVFVKSTKTDSLGFYVLNGLDAGQYYVRIPFFADWEFILHQDSPDSYITNEKGLGSSQMVDLNVVEPKSHFNLGYKPAPGLRNIEESIDIDSGFAIYPNPTIYNINVDLPGEAKPAEYSIYHINGQLIKSGVLYQSGEEIDLTDFKIGYYTIQVKTSEKTYQRRFFRTENY